MPGPAWPRCWGQPRCAARGSCCRNPACGMAIACRPAPPRGRCVSTRGIMALRYCAHALRAAAAVMRGWPGLPRPRSGDAGELPLQGWRRAAGRSALPADLVVGTAPGTPAQTLAPTLAYLDALAGGVAAALEAGGDAARVLSPAAAGPYRHWRYFASRHPLNVQHAWRELEDLG
ncbi:hypothetical protein ACU4GD_10090 [Cupriavidus basilensis]